MNQRLLSLNNQFELNALAKREPTTDVWARLGYDKFLRPEFINKRLATKAMMEKIQPDLIEHVNNTSFPFYVKPLI